MEHVKYDLGQLKKGSTVVVTLGNRANVRLMDSSNYRAYLQGRQHRYQGGQVQRSPFRIVVPRDGHWFVAIDLGGYSGKIRSGIAVQPPPAGLLSAARDAGELDVIRNDAATPPPAGVMGGEVHDVFISYASEDGPAVARPLAEALRERGVTVWLDELELLIGDNLRRRIDRGIVSSRFAVAVFSLLYFAKGWTQYELDGIVNLSTDDKQRLLPIWHNVTKDQVMGYSPSLAGVLARSTSTYTIEEIAGEISAVVAPAAADAA